MGIGSMGREETKPERQLSSDEIQVLQQCMFALMLHM